MIDRCLGLFGWFYFYFVSCTAIPIPIPKSYPSAEPASLLPVALLCPAYVSHTRGHAHARGEGEEKHKHSFRFGLYLLGLLRCFLLPLWLGIQSTFELWYQHQMELMLSDLGIQNGSPFFPTLQKTIPTQFLSNDVSPTPKTWTLFQKGAFSAYHISIARNWTKIKHTWYVHFPCFYGVNMPLHSLGTPKAHLALGVRVTVATQSGMEVTTITSLEVSGVGPWYFYFRVSGVFLLLLVLHYCTYTLTP